jgi:hypothetical protein
VGYENVDYGNQLQAETNGRHQTQEPAAAATGPVPAQRPAGGPADAEPSNDLIDRVHPTVRKWAAEHDYVPLNGGDSFKTNCPAHDDPNASLHVSPGDEIDGCLIHCHGGCSQEQVLDAWGIDWQDLYFDGEYESAGGRRPRTKRELSDAEADLRDAAYQFLLSRLRVAYAEQRDRHRAAFQEGRAGLDWYDSLLEELLRRGLSKEAIERNGYAWMTPGDTAAAAVELYGEIADALPHVPGFYSRNQKGLLPRPLSVGGLAVPVRDLLGRVIALQVRTGDSQRKYIWFSGRVGSGTPCHVSLGTPAECTVVRVTEGPLKADVAFHLDPDNIPTLGVAGVSSWRAALPVLAAVKAKTIRLAFDSDWLVKDQVRQQMAAFWGELERAGFRPELEVWTPRQGKGIDDLFLAGGRSRVVRDQGQLDAFCEEAAEEARMQTKEVRP